jgi:Bacterial Ig domain
MSGRHRQLVAPRNVNRRVVGAGAAGLAAVFAAAPLAMADPVGGTDVPVTSSEAPTTDAPTSAAPSSDAPSSDAPSPAPGSDGPSSDSPPTDESSTGPSKAPAAPRPARVDPKVGAKAEAELPIPDFGEQKIRVGVQIKDGSWVPPGTTTAGTELTIVETGPDVEGGTLTTTCSTEADTATPGSSATFCTFGNDEVRRAAGARPQVIVQPGPSGTPSDMYYFAGAGDTVTITQTSVNANLVADPEPGTVPPCEANVEIPICLTPTDVIFEDTGLPPAADPDSASTLRDHSVDIDVLANDEAHGAPEDIDSTTDPAHGTASIKHVVATASASTLAATSPASILYTPDPGFVGVDTFKYTMSTPNGTSTALVSVTVVPPPPVATDDTASTVSGQPVTIDVRGNDNANGGGALTVQSVGDPGNGTARISDGKVVYTPDDGFVGTDTFTYTVATEFGTDTATVTVTVTGAGLANTGAPSAELLELAAGLLLAGGATTALGRHRRPRGRHA